MEINVLNEYFDSRYWPDPQLYWMRFSLVIVINSIPGIGQVIFGCIQFLLWLSKKIKIKIDPKNFLILNLNGQEHLTFPFFFPDFFNLFHLLIIFIKIYNCYNFEFHLLCLSSILCWSVASNQSTSMLLSILSALLKDFSWDLVPDDVFSSDFLSVKLSR